MLGLVSAALWRPATNGVSGQYVSSAAIDRVYPRSVFVATDAGVYRSADGGASWARAGTPRRALGIAELAIDSVGRVLHGTTRSHGMYRLPVR